MKNRERQRANRRLKEQLLDIKDICGVKDPTPYEAVKEIINEMRKNKERSRHGLYTDVKRLYRCSLTGRRTEHPTHWTKYRI